MQQLDRALIELADRGEAIGPDLMLERLERRLAGEPETVVLALDSRRTAVQTQERKTIGESGHRKSRGPLVAAAAFAGVIAVVGVLLVLGLTGDDSPVPTTTPPAATTAAPQTTVAPVMTVAQGQALMDDFVAALKAGDAEVARALIIDDGSVGPDYLGWLIALDTTGVEFFDCTYEPDSVTCQTTMGPNHFFERIHGENVENTFTATLENGLIVNPSWPAQSADQTAEGAFRIWAQETHPELADVMFDTSFLRVVFTEESGKARAALVDEYLVYRAEQAVDALVSALKAGDAEVARALIIDDGSVGPDYLGWLIALDTTGVEFFDCTYEPDSVTCQTTMGPNHFFERIHGENVENTFTATLENGLIVNPSWPAQSADQTAEGAFRIWAQETHPELADVMFDTSFLRVVFTEESGKARAALVDEYLASL